MFVTRIWTHTTIDFSSFYFLYEINSILFDDVEKSTFDLYDERINSISFLSRERAKAFKKIMQRVKENKAIWNAKIKREIFHENDKVLIRTKKSKKFKIDWYDSYEIVRNKILNIYIFKSFEKSSNKYSINENRMKLINVKKNWTKIDVCLKIANVRSKRKINLKTLLSLRKKSWHRKKNVINRAKFEMLKKMIRMKITFRLRKMNFLKTMT